MTSLLRNRPKGTGQSCRRSDGRRLRWRLAAGLVAVLAGTGLATSAAAAAPSPPAPPPAPGVTPGAAATVAAGEVNMFYTATDGAVWKKEVSGTAIPDSRLGGHLVSGPAAIVSGADEFIVFGRGTDNQLWWTQRIGTNPDGWAPWAPLGGRLTAKPGAALRGPTAADYSVLVRGADGAVWQRDHATSGWGAWHRVGGKVAAGTGPAAEHLSNGQTWMAVVGTNRALYVKQVGSPLGFTSAGGQTTASPALAAPNDTVLVGFVRGTDNAVYYHEFSAATPGWHSIGGRLTSAVAATSFTPPSFGAVYVFGLGTDNQVYDDIGQLHDLSGWRRVT